MRRSRSGSFRPTQTHDVPAGLPRRQAARSRSRFVLAERRHRACGDGAAPRDGLRRHLGKLKLPTMLRDYEKLAKRRAAENVGHAPPDAAD